MNLATHDPTATAQPLHGITAQPAGSLLKGPATACAVMPRKNAPSKMERLLRATVRLPLTQSQAAKIGLGEQFRLALARRVKRQAARQAAAQELAGIIDGMIQRAEAEGISRRELLAKAGISWGTWARCQHGKVNPAIWLPKLKAAESRLNAALKDDAEGAPAI